MPKTRKMGRKKRTYRLKLKRYGEVTRLLPRSIANRVHQFMQVVDKGTISAPSLTGVTETNYLFTLNDLDQVATFTSLFDAYRIDRVQIDFIPLANMFNSASGIGTTPTVVSYLYTAIDHDDAGNLTNVSALRQYESCRYAISYKKVSRIVRPKAAQATFNTSISTFAYSEPKGGLWIDCAYPGVQHYGVRSMITATTGANDVRYNVICKYWLSFKNVR